MTIKKFGKEELTTRQVKNLRKLAAHLNSLPKNYEKFGMSQYFVSNGDATLDPDELRKANYKECGAVACAAGHGPDCGIRAKRNEGWDSYVKRAFGAGCERSNGIWDWCFSYNWRDADNTPHGAAKRITYMLRNGIPEGFICHDESHVGFNQDTVALYWNIRVPSLKQLKLA